VDRSLPETLELMLFPGPICGHILAHLANKQWSLLPLGRSNVEDTVLADEDNIQDIQHNP